MKRTLKRELKVLEIVWIEGMTPSRSGWLGGGLVAGGGRWLLGVF